MRQIFIAVIDVWPRTNWEMVTNNLIAVIEVALIDAVLREVLLYKHSTHMYRDHICECTECTGR